MLDATGYRSILPELKEQFHAWLEQENISIEHTKSMEYQPGRLRCIEYDRNAEGKRYIGPDGEPATRTAIYYPATDPPDGVFK